MKNLALHKEQINRQTHIHRFGFITAQRFASAVYAVVVCYLCVCLSHAGNVSKLLQLRSPIQRRAIAHGLVF